MSLPALNIKLINEVIQKMPNTKTETSSLTLVKNEAKIQIPN